MDPLSTLHQTEVGNLKDGGEQKQVSAQAGRRILSQYTSSSQVSSYNSYEALESEDQGNENVHKGLSGWRGHPE